MEIDWLERSLITGPYMCLVLSEEAYHQALDDLEAPKEGRGPWITSARANATVHWRDHHDGALATIICFKAREGFSPIGIAGLLVHEAVHVWQQWCESVGEDSPSHEFEAYAIQTLAQRLLQSYADQTLA